MIETRSRRSIRQQCKRLGLPIADIVYQPPRRGSEKAGCSGGWEVWFTDGTFAVGENLGLLLEDIERHRL
jgi:hypothetical protein